MTTKLSFDPRTLDPQVPPYGQPAYDPRYGQPPQQPPYLQYPPYAQAPAQPTPPEPAGRSWPAWNTLVWLLAAGIAIGALLALG